LWHQNLSWFQLPLISCKEEVDPHAQQLPSSEKGEGFQSGAIGSNIQSDKEGGSQEGKKQTETSQNILTDNNKQLDPSQTKLPGDNKKLEEVETKTNFDATKTEEEFQKWLDERVVKVETISSGIFSTFFSFISFSVPCI
jgi:hypothetical protein